MVQKIGLMFGSYNPVHSGHVNTAITAKEENRLDLVYMLPVAHSPFKSNTIQATFNDKVNMCKIISSPHSEWLRVSDQCRSFPNSYVDGIRDIKNTIKTFLDKDENELFIVSGEDFRKKFTLALYALEFSKFITKKTSKAMEFADIIMVSDIAKRLENACNILHQASLLDLKRSEAGTSEANESTSVSSSEIREHLKEHPNEKINGITDEVLDYIAEHSLYEM